MKRLSALSTLGLVFAMAHFGLSAWLSSQHFEGSWGYVYLALPDFPVFIVAIILMQVITADSWWPFIILFGSLWWYLLGFLITKLIRRSP